MGYWKARVVPRIMKLFEKDGSKKTAAAEACKAFDETKEEITKAFEEKKAEIQAKVVGIFEQISPEAKATIREPSEAGIKKNAAAIAKFLDDLAELDFPGAKAIGEAIGKYGAALVVGPITFVFEKVSGLLPSPPPEETAAAAAAEEEQKEEKEEETVEKTEEKKEETPSSEIVLEPKPPKEEITEAPASEAAVAEPKVEEASEKPEEEKKEEEKDDTPKKTKEEKEPTA